MLRAAETKLAPEELLDRCLAIEAKLGRVRKEYHGARTMDIDVLLCEGYTSCTEKLTVPHPHIRERAFVMVPLSDLFPAHDALGFRFMTLMRRWRKKRCKALSLGTS